MQLLDVFLLLFIFSSRIPEPKMGVRKTATAAVTSKKVSSPTVGAGPRVQSGSSSKLGQKKQTNVTTNR